MADLDRSGSQRKQQSYFTLRGASHETRIFIRLCLCLQRHRSNYVGFPTMSSTVSGTALIGLLRLFGVDIVQRSLFCRN